MTLPESKRLPVHLLAACFNKRSATYKFYWLLSILQACESGVQVISKRELFSRMISNAWFTVNYFRVSFGKLDLIQDTIRSILNIEDITIDERREVVFRKLMRAKNTDTQKLLWHFNNTVPHWFLTPWFPKIKNEKDNDRKQRIYSGSLKPEFQCLYALHNDYIEINPDWAGYLAVNAKVLKSFCYWNLALYLQAKNPNVPDIPNKLIKPAKRNTLAKQRTKFWDVVLHELESVDCIYTGNKLTIGNYAIEHFIPYSFVSHDLIWNLIPADKSFNSSKGNKLPLLDRHFKPFYSLQRSAYEIVKKKSPGNELLKDYITVFPAQEATIDEVKLMEVIQPLISIASNNGFEFMSDAKV